MKKLLIILLVLTGCGDADLIKAPNEIAPRSGNFNLLTTQEVDPMLRDGGILIYPNDEHFQGYSNIFNQGMYDFMFSGRFKRVPKDIPGNLSNFNKKVNFVTQVMSVGAVRNASWETLSINNKKIADLENDLYDKYISKFPCYTIKEGDDQGMCRLEAGSDTWPDAEYQYTCEDILYSRDNFIGLTADQSASFETETDLCVAEDNGRLSKWYDESAQAEERRVVGKDLFVQLFETIEDNVKANGNEKKFYVSISSDDSFLSLQQTAPGFYEIQAFSLLIDNGKGNAVYSVENGKIKVEKFVQLNNGQKYIDLEIDLGDFTVKTDLWFATHNHFDLRLVSNNFLATYKDGTKCSGVMTMELNFAE